MNARVLLYLLSFSLLTISCGDNTEEYTADKQTIRFVELSHGVAKENAGAHNNSVSNDEYADDFAVAKETDTIEAKPGARFGVRYMLESNMDPVITLRQVWVFPDSMHDEEGEVYKSADYEINKKPNEENYAAYQLDYPYEVMKGKWQLRFYYKKHLLYRKIFVLI